MFTITINITYLIVGIGLFWYKFKVEVFRLLLLVEILTLVILFDLLTLSSILVITLLLLIVFRSLIGFVVVVESLREVGNSLVLRLVN